MAAVGFKEYRNDDRYAGRRAVNKGMNMIWRIIVTIVVVVGLVYIIKYLTPWGKTVSDTITKPAKYEGVPNFYK